MCWNLYCSGISAEKIPEHTGVHRATVYRWLTQIKRIGINEFIRRYRVAKKGHRHRKTNEALKARVYEIREKYRQCCGEKIQYFLKQEYGDEISLTTIYRVLSQKYRLRGKWKSNEKRGRVLKGTKPREVIQVDTVDFGSIYAFTAIDTYTREASVVLKTHLDAKDGEDALIEQLRFFGTVERIQRDGGPEFKAEWHEKARTLVTAIRTARPYRKNEQAFIERFNGILRKECLGYTKYKKSDLHTLQLKVKEFLIYYHFIRPHLSLNMLTPRQFAMSHLM